MQEKLSGPGAMQDGTVSRHSDSTGYRVTTPTSIKHRLSRTYTAHETTPSEFLRSGVLYGLVLDTPPKAENFFENGPMTDYCFKTDTESIIHDTQHSFFGGRFDTNSRRGKDSA